MRKKLRKVFTVLLSMVFIAGIGLMIRQALSYYNAEQARQDALALVHPVTQADATEATTPAPTTEIALPEIPTEATEAPAIQQAPLEDEAKFLLDLDLSPLQSVNSDVLGWIYITGGEISYPLLRSYDNRDYLHKTWEKKFSNAGSVFLECKNNRSLQDFNTIIYGHHMFDGSVFASMVNYRDPEYLTAHPYIYIFTGKELRRYEIFSTYEAELTSDTYRLYYPDLETRYTALRHFVESSQVATGIIPSVTGHILTLSTCVGNNTYETRWVVQAQLTGLWTK